MLAGIEVDDDFGVKLAQFGQQRSEQCDRIDFLGGDPDRSAEIARRASRRLREAVRGQFDLLGLSEQLLAGGGQNVTRLTLFEERQADRPFQCRSPPRHRCLADPQRAAGGKSAAFPRDGKEIAQVVPVEHGERS